MIQEQLLTIGMPVYNEEKYIAESIESLLGQTYKDFTLIISDNASSDRTSDICRYYAKKDKRIIYIRQTENKGGLFNFKYVLDKANTPFFMWAGGHDKWHPQFIEKLLPIIENRKDLVAINSKAREIKLDGSLGKIHKRDYTTTQFNKPTDRYLYFLKHLNCNIIYGIWRTSILKNCWFKPIINWDILMILDATLRGKFKQDKEILFFRRIVCEEKNEYRRQLIMITGKYNSKLPPLFLSKCQFIFENVKMLFMNNPSLNITSKCILSIRTIFFWFELWNIVPIFKKIVPDNIYVFLKNKIIHCKLYTPS